jgi:hypothetical protein
MGVLEDSATAACVLAFRDLVDQLAAADPPRGHGRD